MTSPDNGCTRRYFGPWRRFAGMLVSGPPIMWRPRAETYRTPDGRIWRAGWLWWIVNIGRLAK